MGGKRGRQVIRLIEKGYKPDEINALSQSAIYAILGSDSKTKITKHAHSSGWHPEWGWLEPDEIDELQSTGEVKRPTVAEKQSGYLLTEEEFNERRTKEGYGISR